MQLLKNRNVLIATTKPLRRRPFFFLVAARYPTGHWPLAARLAAASCAGLAKASEVLSFSLVSCF
jgi:hypothetical protein